MLEKKITILGLPRLSSAPVATARAMPPRSLPRGGRGRRTVAAFAPGADAEPDEKDAAGKLNGAVEGREPRHQERDAEAGHRRPQRRRHGDAGGKPDRRAEIAPSGRAADHEKGRAGADDAEHVGEGEAGQRQGIGHARHSRVFSSRQA
jgi:hypothetical protein